MTHEYKLSWARSDLPVGTAITAKPNDDGLPTLSAYIEPIMGTPWWEITVTAAGDRWPMLVCECHRGKAFAAIVAKEMLRGVYSRLGRHRRQTAHRSKNREVR